MRLQDSLCSTEGAPLVPRPDSLPPPQAAPPPGPGLPAARPLTSGCISECAVGTWNRSISSIMVPASERTQAGRGQGRQRDRAGRQPQEPVGWCRLGRPGRVGRAGGRAERRVGAGREFRWRVEARVAPWAGLALPRLWRGRAAGLASPPPPPPPPVNSSATAVTRQLHFRVRAPPGCALFMRGRYLGAPAPPTRRGY